MHTAPTSGPGRRFDKLLERLGASQTRRPFLYIGLCLASLGLCLPLALRLELHTRFEHMLPEGRASVLEMQRLTRLARSSMNGFVILEGASSRELRRLADALVPRLRALGPPIVSAESGIHAARAFLLPRAGLFARLPDLVELRDEVQARWDHEVGKRAGTLVDDTPPPDLSLARLRKRFLPAKAPSAERFKDGYFESKDGRALIVLVRTRITGGDLEGGREALRRIRAAVDEVRASRPEHRRVAVGYAGELQTQIAEYGAVRDDLMHVGIVGAIMILGVVLIFFVRMRALIALTLTIATGVAWTFALTRITIGHLNMATGFLFSIVVGNGINAGIIYMARFFEERRKGLPPPEALAMSHRTTWLPTLTAALAAAAAYASLGVTEFRAFKHFALIGAAGMFLCWVATYLMLPAVLIVADRWTPFRGDTATVFHRLRLLGVRYDAPLSWLVSRAPRAIAVGGVLAALAGAALLPRYILSEPLEYDARRMQNDVASSRGQHRLTALAIEILGAGLESSMIVVCDRPDQALALRAVLERRRREAPAGVKPFEAVHTLFDFVPPMQAEKIPVLLELRELLLKVHRKGAIPAKEWDQVKLVLPPADLRPFTVAELPEELAYPFSDTRGQRGTVVAIEPTAGQHDWDIRYLMRWADSFRETRLPSGEVIRGSGTAVIYADMLSSVMEDIPKAVGLSFGLTVLAVVLAFRRRYSIGVVISLLTGVSWIALYLVGAHVRINFLNFMAIPITFGIGVDYAVNFFQRYAHRGALDAGQILATTGGAVVLCSMTTTLGYLALLSSVNQSIRGLGALAVVGEASCLLAALLVTPAALLWRARRRAAEQPARPPSPSTEEEA
jgi:predicted RND superfamily exporter protein